VSASRSGVWSGNAPPPTATCAFARISFRGREALFFVYVATLVIPQEVTVIPLFLIMKDIGWIDSYQALIVPPAFTAFGTFLLRQFFRGIPRELEDAARLDGASRPVILTRIMLPLARPALGALAVFTFIGYWNSFLWPLIVINSAEKATVPLGLDMFVTQTVERWNLLAAASLIAAAPSLLLVIALQRSFVRGIVIAGFGGR